MLKLFLLKSTHASQQWLQLVSLGLVLNQTMILISHEDNVTFHISHEGSRDPGRVLKHEVFSFPPFFKYHNHTIFQTWPKNSGACGGASYMASHLENLCQMGLFCGPDSLQQKAFSKFATQFINPGTSGSQSLINHSSAILNMFRKNEASVRWQIWNGSNLLLSGEEPMDTAQLLCVEQVAGIPKPVQIIRKSMNCGPCGT